MWKLVHFELWPELRRRAKVARKRLGAVAYATTDMQVEFGAGDLLVVDATEEAIAGGVTSAALLKRTLDRGARIFSCPGLHSKVMVFDRVAVVGSANLSATSENDKIEAAFMTDYAPAVKAARSFIDTLAKKHSTELNRAIVRRLLAIPVKRRPPESKKLEPSAQKPNDDKPPVHRTTRRSSRYSKDPKTFTPGKFDYLPNSSLRNQRVIFSGDLKSYPRRRREAFEVTRRAGGLGDYADNVGDKTGIVVIGAKGSPFWKFGNMGVSWANALKRKKRTGKPLIIDESTWLRAVKRRS